MARTAGKSPINWPCILNTAANLKACHYLCLSAKSLRRGASRKPCLSLHKAQQLLEKVAVAPERDRQEPDRIATLGASDDSRARQCRA